MLNYVLLETLKFIDEHGTIEGAARALRVSSFAVAQRIRQLEKSLYVKLLERAPTRVSDVGKILCDHVNQALSLQNEILNESQDGRLERDNRPSYKIALLEDITTGSFTEIIKQLKQDSDPSKFDITICHPEKSNSHMQSGDVAEAISIRKTPIHGFKAYSLNEITHQTALPRRPWPDAFAVKCIGPFLISISRIRICNLVHIQIRETRGKYFALSSSVFWNKDFLNQTPKCPTAAD